ncbi:hypothetical protein ACJRO7_014513 [Eucalyptus globulus]|uniref:Protein kinase domain-containing protein n=1 Tax=Eucalyptus globulus TaxID=34317 RepID=A0ABD3L6D7_EUCGL
MFLLLIVVSVFLGSQEAYSLTSSSLEPTNYFFPSFDPSSCTCKELICTGSASLRERYLNITPELEEQGNSSLVPMPTNQVGWALYSWPVVAWPAMISTTFSVRITTLPNSIASGGVGRQLAVELDTFMNEFDPDGNHSLNSTGVNLKSGRDLRVKIDYYGYKYNLSDIFWEFASNLVYVGFLGSNGPLPESHQVINWVFISFPLSMEERVMTVLLIAIFVYLPVEKAPRKRNKKDMFTCNEVAKATHLLGTGGFGSLYKGLISDPPVKVAVKKISTTSKLGLLPYLYHILLAHFLEHGPSLGWETRYEILIGLASALLCLHKECGNPMVHKDVKPNNVMLDSNYNAYSSDFVVQIFLNPNKPLMELPESRPRGVYVPVSFLGLTAATFSSRTRFAFHPS